MCIHIYTVMTSKTINIKESVFKSLKSLKRKNESFSDLISRFIGKEEKNVLDFLKDIPENERKEISERALFGKEILKEIKPREMTI